MFAVFTRRPRTVMRTAISRDSIQEYARRAVARDR
jgi:hypothetical protein